MTKMMIGEESTRGKGEIWGKPWGSNKDSECHFGFNEEGGYKPSLWT